MPEDMRHRYARLLADQEKKRALQQGAQVASFEQDAEADWQADDSAARADVLGMEEAAAQVQLGVPSREEEYAQAREKENAHTQANYLPRGLEVLKQGAQGIGSLIGQAKDAYTETLDGMTAPEAPAPNPEIDTWVREQVQSKGAAATFQELSQMAEAGHPESEAIYAIMAQLQNETRNIAPRDRIALDPGGPTQGTAIAGR